ncbi:BnaCnng32810D [Brassica napus]|uniref:BnaCnng32810D protein n=4 Tax=Brassica TaxID=3705 RepID=A0A078J5S7_BRANA|nr:BnaCnng32810D [Brassica napus]VDD35722.1 unnamed protein product [Brassica oleracea]
MAWRNAGSTARSFVSAAARAPSLRSPTAALPRLRPSPSSLPGRRSSFSLPSRNIGALGCTQSFLPLYSVVAASQLTSHLNVNLRAFCELSNELIGIDKELKWYLKRLRVYNASVHASVTLKVCKRSKEWGYLRKNLNRYVTFVLEI